MIGRVEEREILQECLESRRPEFIVIYGRRRVGKTFLVKEFFQDHYSFYTTGINQVSNRQQLSAFHEALKKYGCTEKIAPKNWFEAFSRLREVLSIPSVTREFRSGKRVVFLDELPWMDAPRSDFRGALDYFWNSWGSTQKDLILIVCGSATSWIITHIVHDTGGFYNRITRQIHLLPFRLKECQQLLDSNGVHLPLRQLMEAYMVFGGIPYYLNYLNSQFSLAQNIDMLFFRENGPLRYEYQQLFSSLFKNATHHISIVEALFDQQNGLTREELLRHKNLPDGKMLTKCLEELEQCGFIRKYTDFTTRGSRFVFQLIDSFTLFYLTWLKKHERDSWLDLMDTPAYFNWGGIAFERVCLLHSNQIKESLGISGIRSSEYAWRSKKNDSGAQIDLLIDRRDDVISLCEAKFSNEEFRLSAKYEKELIHKAEVFREESGTRKAIQVVMITLNGLADSIHNQVVTRQLTGEDLLR